MGDFTAASLLFSVATGIRGQYFTPIPERHFPSKVVDDISIPAFAFGQAKSMSVFTGFADFFSPFTTEHTRIVYYILSSSGTRNLRVVIGSPPLRHRGSWRLRRTTNYPDILDQIESMTA